MVKRYLSKGHNYQVGPLAFVKFGGFQYHAAWSVYLDSRQCNSGLLAEHNPNGNCKKYSSILPSAGFIKPALEHATFTVIIAKKRLCWSSLELFGVVRISLEVAQTLNFLLPDLVSGLLQQV